MACLGVKGAVEGDFADLQEFSEKKAKFKPNKVRGESFLSFEVATAEKIFTVPYFFQSLSRNVTQYFTQRQTPQVGCREGRVSRLPLKKLSKWTFKI